MLQGGMDGLLHREVFLIEILPEPLDHVDGVVDPKTNGKRRYRHREHVQRQGRHGIPPSVVGKDIMNEGDERHGPQDPGNIQSHRNNGDEPELKVLVDEAQDEGG